MGFTFDGKNVTIRDKTLSKYYYRMYKKVRSITKHKGITHKGNKISCKQLYLKYSERGAKCSETSKGNFLSYVNRAKHIFKGDTQIDRGTKRHMQKIRKRLKTI